jgi:hypothetical protein
VRRLIASGVGALIALVLVSPAATAAGTGRVACPLQPGNPSGGDVQWAFTDSGRPAGNTVKSSYVHGRGNWTKGKARGTACTTDSLKAHAGVRDLVLRVSGKSKLTGRVKQNGVQGVRLVLGVKVHASDDKACAAGTAGKIRLFASYGSVHRDAMRIVFGSHCTGHNFSYRGSSLHVYIARHGGQVT